MRASSSKCLIVPMVSWMLYCLSFYFAYSLPFNKKAYPKQKQIEFNLMDKFAPVRKFHFLMIRQIVGYFKDRTI
jgi:hypothetical protein